MKLPIQSIGVTNSFTRGTRNAVHLSQRNPFSKKSGSQYPVNDFETGCNSTCVCGTREGCPCCYHSDRLMDIFPVLKQQRYAPSAFGENPFKSINCWADPVSGQFYCIHMPPTLIDDLLAFPPPSSNSISCTGVSDCDKMIAFCADERRDIDCTGYDNIGQPTACSC